MLNARPTIIGIGGFESSVGKTTLMCELLCAFPGWEAIKTTRGHYRSCGKDPQACCVSHLLRDQPVVRSGREATYEPGKDTGRYWDAGASNVHWVIATEDQVDNGITEALTRVVGPGVFIEGNSFSAFVAADLMVMVARASSGKVKSSARRALTTTSAIYLSDLANKPSATREEFALWRSASVVRKVIGELPVYTRADLPKLIARLQRIHSVPVV